MCSSDLIEPALITGASSGIGLELARIMARNGHELVLAARNKAELERIAAELTAQHGAKVHVVASDLSQPEAPQALYDAVQALGVPVGVSRYRMPSSRTKIVHYWAAEATDAAVRTSTFVPNKEIAAIEWVGVKKARKHLSYPVDIEIGRAHV